MLEIDSRFSKLDSRCESGFSKLDSRFPVGIFRFSKLDSRFLDSRLSDIVRGMFRGFILGSFLVGKWEIHIRGSA